MRQAQSPGLQNFSERLDRQGAKTFRGTFIISHDEPQRALDLVFAGSRCILLARITTSGWAFAGSGESLADRKTDVIPRFGPEETGRNEVGPWKRPEWTVKTVNRQPGGLTA